ncbi:MAG: RIP metalloprotease RseP [Desulfobulbus propionicus]|nr:MAG: RIP metalloprotease RseP [Desulfobulbus propionicus]
MNSIFSFVIVLGLLIFVHELGHFLVAKAFGVRVLKFSLGFGSRVVGRTWGETEYLVSAIPLGGYVKMYGEQVDDEVAESEREVSFAHKPVWQRFGIVLAGPLFNLLFAVVLFFMMFFVVGRPDTTVIGEVASGSVAEQMGLHSGDEIRSIDGQPTTSWQQVSELIGDSGGAAVNLVVLRDGNELHFTGTPVMDKEYNFFGEEIGERYLLGITRSEQVVYEPVGVVAAVEAAVAETWELCTLTVLGIVKMLQRVIPASELGGPIRIAELAGQSLEAGWLNLVWFTGLLSVNLGILNLLPIPVLDGGHLVFLTLEGLRRKPLSEQAMLVFQKMGIALLATLMLFVFYNDIHRLVQRWLGA